MSGRDLCANDVPAQQPLYRTRDTAEKKATRRKSFDRPMRTRKFCVEGGKTSVDSLGQVEADRLALTFPESNGASLQRAVLASSDLVAAWLQ